MPLYHTESRGIARREWYVGSMKRREALEAVICGLFATACGARQAKEVRPLPAMVGAWTRASLRSGRPEDAPEPARSMKPSAWTEADYESGSRKVRVNAFVLPVEAAAFELQQKWRRGNGVTSFYRGNYFAACASEQLETGALVEFASQLEAAWLGDSGS